jgi:heavy metal efflux system protein
MPLLLTAKKKHSLERFFKLICRTPCIYSGPGVPPKARPRVGQSGRLERSESQRDVPPKQKASALFVIFLLLFALCRNFKFPLITVLGVLLSAPVGGMVALWLTHTPLSVSSGIGFLALFGVSVQTAVVYISYVNELRGGGMELRQAIREGAILRLRPIMMTALVAALGLLPAALATGVGTDSQRPFALVIVSGLFTRLLISVFLMPALYVLVARPTDRLEV